MLNKKKRRFSRKVGHRGGFRKRAFGAVVAIAAIGTSVGAAHSLVMPMLIDGSIEDRAASVFTYQNQVSASLARSDEHTSELQSLMRISYAVYCLKKKIS